MTGRPAEGLKAAWIGVGVAAVIGIAAVAALSGIEPQEARVYGEISTENGSPILGDPEAPVTIIEFGDYQCHGCHNWFLNTKPLITRDYIETGKANLIFVDLAILGQDSWTAAQASHCAGEQDMFWEYHDAVYNNHEDTIDGGWASKENLVRFAGEIGLDADEFKWCLDSNKYADRVRSNTNEGKSNGISATPGFFIVGKDGQSDLITGAQPYITFKHFLDEMS